MQSVLLVLSLMTAHPDYDAARQDRGAFAASDHPYIYYFSTTTVDVEKREELGKVLCFVLPSLSSDPYLADQLPVKVTETLYRIDTRGLKWEHTLPQVLIKHYPYAPEATSRYLAPLVIDASWFVAEVTDPIETGNSQYLLLYGKELSNAKEFRTFWKVQEEAKLNFGRIEGKSGVALERTRLIENNASGNRGYHWQTFDSRVVAGEADPLENLTKRPPKHDASELIAAIPKHMNGEAGTLQAYFLSNGSGQRQDRAPADIVADNTGVRGVEIRNSISCIACHVEGLRPPTLDQYREYILSGARISADKLTQREIDRYLDSPFAKELKRNQEDYAAGVKMCNGLTPEENAKSFVSVVRDYDSDITLERAARELGSDKREFQLALGDYSRLYSLDGRLALLSADKAISRKQWASNYALAYKILLHWRAQ